MFAAIHGGDVVIVVNVTDGTDHVAAVIDTATTRLDSHPSAVPVVSTIGTGIYKVTFSGLSPSPAVGAVVTAKVNGTISGEAFTETGFAVLILPAAADLSGLVTDDDLPANFGTFSIDESGNVTTAGGQSIDVDTLAVSLAQRISLHQVQNSGGVLSQSSLVIRGTTWQVPLMLTPLPNDWQKIEATVRLPQYGRQADSLLHVRLSNPAAAGDGLLIWDRMAASDASLALIEVPQNDSENVILQVDASLTASAPLREFKIDAKVWTESQPNVQQLHNGTLTVGADITLATD